MVHTLYLYSHSGKRATLEIKSCRGLIRNMGLEKMCQNEVYFFKYEASVFSAQSSGRSCLRLPQLSWFYIEIIYPAPAIRSLQNKGIKLTFYVPLDGKSDDFIGALHIFFYDY